MRLIRNTAVNQFTWLECRAYVHPRKFVGLELIAILVEHNGYLSLGKAAKLHPYEPCDYPAGNAFKRGRADSVVEVGRVELPSFTLGMPELAEFFGMELCRIAADECLVSR